MQSPVTFTCNLCASAAIQDTQQGTTGQINLVTKQHTEFYEVRRICVFDYVSRGLALCSFYSTAAETLYSAPRRFGKFIEMQNPREAIRITMRRSWPYKVSRSRSRSEAAHTSNTARSSGGSGALRHCAASRGQNHSLPGRSVSRQRLIESAATALTRFTGREFSLKYTRDCCCFCLLFVDSLPCALFAVPRW